MQQLPVLWVICPRVRRLWSLSITSWKHQKWQPQCKNSAKKWPRWYFYFTYEQVLIRFFYWLENDTFVFLVKFFLRENSCMPSFSFPVWERLGYVMLATWDICFWLICLLFSPQWGSTNVAWSYHSCGYDFTYVIELFYVLLITVVSGWETGSSICQLCGSYLYHKIWSFSIFLVKKWLFICKPIRVSEPLPVLFSNITKKGSYATLSF